MSEYGAVKGWKNRIRIGVSSAVNESIWKAGRDPLLNSFSVETGVDIEKISVIGSRQPVSIVEGVTEVSGSIERNLYSKNATYNEFIYVNDTTHYDLLKATGLGGTEGLECKILWNPVSDDVDDGYERVITNVKFHNYRIAHAARDIVAESVDYDASRLKIVKGNRQMITILGTSETLYDYQVKIELDSSNFDFDSSSDDGSDIHFVDNSDNELPFWIESWGDDHAVVWCKIPVIPAGGTVYIWMIYGDTGPHPSSNGDATFDFFDDFKIGSTPVYYDKIFDVVKLKPWTRYEGNPVLIKSDSGWDSVGVRDPTLMINATGYLVRENGKYIMYYSGKDASGIGRGGRAISDDGIHWTKDPNNPVLEGTAGEWDADGVGIGSVVKRGTNDYIMFYGGHANNTYGIGVAESSDGINWTKYSGNPILTASDFNLDSPYSIVIPYAIKLSDGRWVMYVEGTKAPLFAIYGAITSDSDGETGWTPLNGGDPVVERDGPFTWDDHGVANPKICEIESGKYIMGYNGQSSSLHWKLGFLYSTDLVNWERYFENPVMDLAPDGEWDDYRIENALIAKDDIGGDTIRMWYFGCPTSDACEDCAIGYATCNQSAIKGYLLDTSKWVTGNSKYLYAKTDAASMDIHTNRVILDDYAYHPMSLNNFAIEFEYYLESSIPSSLIFIGASNDFGTFNSISDFIAFEHYGGSSVVCDTHPTSRLGISIGNSPQESDYWCNDPDVGVWLRCSLKRLSNTAYITIQNLSYTETYLNTNLDISGIASLDFLNIGGKYTGSDLKAHAYIKNLRVRKHTSPEPTVII